MRTGRQQANISRMPLKCRESVAPDVSDPLFVRWAMSDGNRDVKLAVGTDTLKDLAITDGRDARGPLALWEHYRDELEAAADRHYNPKSDNDILLRFILLRPSR